VIKVLVGNKIDLVDERKVPRTEAEELASKVNAQYFEVSAKTGDGINALFLLVATTTLKAALQKSESAHRVKVNAKKSFCILL